MTQINYQMKIAICDDDEKDRNRVVGLVCEYLDIHHYHIGVEEFHSGESLLAADVMTYELAVLDIHMGALNGIETARELIRRNPGMQIILCSSTNSYASESYDVSALRYLLKPVDREKLFDTLDRFFLVHTTLKTLTFKQNRMEEHVYLRDVLWIEADGHHCIIHTTGGDITTRAGISQFARQLEGTDFVKPIRYALVSLQAVAVIPTDAFTLVDGSRVPIARDQRPAMKKAFTDFKMRSMMKQGGVPQ